MTVVSPMAARTQVSSPIGASTGTQVALWYSNALIQSYGAVAFSPITSSSQSSALQNKLNPGTNDIVLYDDAYYDNGYLKFSMGVGTLGFGVSSYAFSGDGTNVSEIVIYKDADPAGGQINNYCFITAAGQSSGGSTINLHAARYNTNANVSVRLGSRYYTTPILAGSLAHFKLSPYFLGVRSTPDIIGAATVNISYGICFGALWIAGVPNIKSQVSIAAYVMLVGLQEENRTDFETLITEMASLIV